MSIINFKPKENIIFSTEESCEEFEKKIKENMKRTYSKQFSLYQNIFNKVNNHFFQEKSKTIYYEDKKITTLLNNIKEGVNNFFSSIWLLYKNVIEMEIEEISQKIFESKTQGIPVETEELQEKIDSENTSGRATVEWDIEEGSKIYDYLPLVEVNKGVVSRDLNIGDRIIVCLSETKEETPALLPYTEKIKFQAEIIDRVIDQNQCLRFLILLENGQYGDVEVYDQLVKIKTAKDNVEEKPNKEISTVRLSWNITMYLTIFVICVIIVYLLISGL